MPHLPVEQQDHGRGLVGTGGRERAQPQLGSADRARHRRQLRRRRRLEPPHGELGCRRSTRDGVRWWLRPHGCERWLARDRCARELVRTRSPCQPAEDLPVDRPLQGRRDATGKQGEQVAALPGVRQQQRQRVHVAAGDLLEPRVLDVEGVGDAVELQDDAVRSVADPHEREERAPRCVVVGLDQRRSLGTHVGAETLDDVAVIGTGLLELCAERFDGGRVGARDRPRAQHVRRNGASVVSGRRSGSGAGDHGDGARGFGRHGDEVSLTAVVPASGGTPPAHAKGAPSHGCLPLYRRVEEGDRWLGYEIRRAA